MNWVAQFWLGLVLACCGGLALCALCFPCIAIMDGVPTGGVGRRITRAVLDGLAAPSVLEHAPDLGALAVYPSSMQAKDLARKKSGGPQESTSHRRSDTIRSWYGTMWGLGRCLCGCLCGCVNVCVGMRCCSALFQRGFVKLTAFFTCDTFCMTGLRLTRRRHGLARRPCSPPR